jgi:uncharacterized protein
MTNIWRAAKAGDLAEVERQVGQDPSLLDDKAICGYKPLMLASEEGHVGVVRWLLDKGADIHEQDDAGRTPLHTACLYGRPPVVRLLLERGADPTLVIPCYGTPLIEASFQGHLEVVRILLGHPSARATINYRDSRGETALYNACDWGRGVVARALLESGADPTIADKKGITPMAIAKQTRSLPQGVTAEGRRDCVVALEVRSCLPLPFSLSQTPALVMRWLRSLVLGTVVGRRRSGPTCSGRPGRWRMRLQAGQCR